MHEEMAGNGRERFGLTHMHLIDGWTGLRIMNIRIGWHGMAWVSQLYELFRDRIASLRSIVERGYAYESQLHTRLLAFLPHCIIVRIQRMAV